ncbi:MAG: zinc-dependent alcohol dehydrogenase family protein [Thermodesulfobacteriota bacterium]
MRAMLLHGFGDVSNLRMGDIPRPEPGPGQVLVRVAAASVNPIDVKIRRMAPAFAPEPPAVPGMDFAGLVEELGEGVEGFAPGDEVYGCAGGLRGRQGALAELMPADVRFLAPKPRTLSLREAAALPLVAITAWDALHNKAGMRTGEHLLVHGGAGGVGHVAVQLAKAAGLRVAATVSSRAKADIVRLLGADDAVNYREEEPASYTGRLTGGAGFDLVLDTVGGAVLDASFALARPRGRVVSTNTRSTHDLSTLHAKALTLHVVFMLLPMLSAVAEPDYGAVLREVAGLAEAGRLAPLLDERAFSLERAAEAHSLVESGQAVGKVVVDVA